MASTARIGCDLPASPEQGAAVLCAWPGQARQGPERRHGPIPIDGSIPDLALQLHNLRVFLSVARAGSMARAADQLFKARSAVTRAILDLETALGKPLFIRRPRGIVLTPFGQIVKRHAQAIDDMIVEATRAFVLDPSRQINRSPHAVAALICNGRKLQLVVELARTRTISYAAQAMGMTQAGASMALARLEEGLGSALFLRRNHGMIRTDAGDKLIHFANRIFADLRALAQTVRAQPVSAQGTVVVGTTPLGRTGTVAAALAAAIAANPELRILTVESNYNQLQVMLAAGEVDLLIGAMRPDAARNGIVSEPLFEDRLAILARADHPVVRLARAGPISLARLAGEQWILPSMRGLAAPAIASAFAKARLSTPVASVETGDTSIVRYLLETTDMLAITTAHHFADDLTKGRVCELEVTEFHARRHIAMVRKSAMRTDPACLAVVNAMRAIATTGDWQRA